MDRLKGKIAIITGAASGIGKAAAVLFAKESATLVICDINDKDGEEVAATIKTDGGKCDYIHCDVSEEADDIRMIDFVMNKYGRIDCYVANAGFAGSSDLADMWDFKNMEKCFKVNVYGFFYQMKHLLPIMEHQGGGSIVSINSASPLRPTSYPSYAASKGALRAMTMDLANLYAPKKIRINKIHPGVVDTPMTVGVCHDPVLGPLFLKNIPYGQYTPAEAIAQAILYLASDESDHVVGAELSVCGGFNLGAVL